MRIKRGELYYADLNHGIGSEQDGIRPVLIIQNNVGNKYSPTVIVASITADIHSKHRIPTHLWIPAKDRLKQDSVILLEQIRTIDKSRLKNKLGKLSVREMIKVNYRLLISLELINMS